jgi:SMC interacting uncharacterized protein involved in chromosome segregation
MSLANEELEQVRDIVIDAVQSVTIPHFEMVTADIAGLKQDIGGLKEDVRILKEDVRILKEDVRGLKADMREVKGSLNRLEGRVEALEADVKELYAMINASAKSSSGDKRDSRLSVEQKVLQMYQDVKLLAREAGVTLPN